MNTKKMPVLFIGHGSPMNALASNDYTRALNRIKDDIETPKAILLISAHWMTKETKITAMPYPRTIHDFYGFPKDLFAINYKAPGDPALAEMIIKSIESPRIGADLNEWGLDHGAWSVLLHIYPEANIPVLQLSLDMSKPAEYHFELGQKLRFLREKGILIIASGNIVHNLRQINWDESATPLEWALEFDQWVKEKAEKGDFKSLVNDFTKTRSGVLSNPTPEHYFPLLYILGASDEKDQLSFPYEGIQNGSMSMRSFKWAQR